MLSYQSIEHCQKMTAAASAILAAGRPALRTVGTIRRRSPTETKILVEIDKKQAENC